MQNNKLYNIYLVHLYMIGSNNIILILIVGFVVVYLFEKISANPAKEKFIEYNIKENIRHSHPHIIPASSYVPLKEPQISTQYKISRELSEEDIQRCPYPTQTVKEFNKDFFNFRDKTEINTSIDVDPVDKILTMEIQPGMAIKDYFDELTAAKNDLYPNKTTRYPYFDNVMHDGYDASHVTGLHNVRDTWIYQNENILNGGQVAQGLTPFNPEHEFFPSLESIVPLKNY
jgi:hypothetical protein